MKVWLITIGEPLPTDSDSERLLRTGLLFEVLTNAGDEVVWWTSAFNHTKKKFRAGKDTREVNCLGGVIKLLHGCGYRKNISISRFVDHYLLAREFKNRISGEESPDIILVSYPSIELCYEAAMYGKAVNIPVVIDLRDFWPDVFYDWLPTKARTLAKIAFYWLEKKADAAFKEASAVTGITNEFLDWGIRRAGRERTKNDIAFPMGYKRLKIDRVSENNNRELESKIWTDLGLSEDDWIACFFGTIGHHFDLETVIEAAKSLLNKNFNIKIVLCGDGDKRQFLKKKSTAITNVLFPGWVNRYQISSLMNISKVGIAPHVNTESFMLSLPNKSLEYLSAGLPVITSLDGVLGDTLSVHECGMIYKAGDSESLCDVLVDFHDNESKLVRYSSNAKSLFEEKFSADVVYEQMRGYLKAFLGN